MVPYIEGTMAQFPFSDLHSFKDFVIYVQTYLPDRFPRRAAANAEDQWSLELAFEGLRHGIAIAVAEKGEIPDLVNCGRLVEEAHKEYSAGRRREGFFVLGEVNGLLRKIPSG